MKYFPIPTNPNIEAGRSGLVDLSWQLGALIADFIIPNRDEEVLRVWFSSVEIFRVLDEMPLSTEEDWKVSEGLLRNNFSYRVTGSRFWNSQSDIFLMTGKYEHYRFVTGGDCLDVISTTSPSFSVKVSNSKGL